MSHRTLCHGVGCGGGGHREDGSGNNVNCRIAAPNATCVSDFVFCLICTYRSGLATWNGAKEESKLGKTKE